MENRPFTDTETSVYELRKAVLEFRDERGWLRYHTPKSLAMSIAIEAAELMEHFQWLTDEESSHRITDTNVAKEIAGELADILIYCLSFANRAEIDVSRAVQFKLNHNRNRFPPSSA
jgi:NTP pyrophosphatase (non-canonical NTP hydrolase)